MPFDESINILFLLLMLLMPMVGGVGLARLAGNDVRAIRSAALGLTCTTLLMAIMIGLIFATSESSKDVALSFDWKINWISNLDLSVHLGLDAISLWLVLLTAFLMPIVVLATFTEIKQRVKEFYMWLLILETAMLGVFLARDLITFYLCFEFTLVPLFFLIGIYGGPKRLKAAKVLFLYSFTGSMLTLAGFLYVAWWYVELTGGIWTFRMDLLIAAAAQMSPSQQTWVLLALLAGFAVKVPLFPVHTWLPLAHTEAPTAGSVILAGVLLKLGTYAMLTLAIPMAPDAVARLTPLIGTLAVIGILYAALICWVQKDIKRLIAYSSVSHMGFCVLGMFALNVIGVSGSVLYMINHGLSTGALFLCVGMIYERLHERDMTKIRGLGKIMPIWASFMVFFCLASVGLPGLNGFVGEFLTLLGTFLAGDRLGPGYAIAAGFGMILTAVYILYMVGKVVFGPLKLPPADRRQDPVRDLTAREITVLAPLAIACLVLGLYPQPVLRSIEAPVTALIATATPTIKPRPSVAGIASSDTAQATVKHLP
jgi:NADH-quinone oxidoreductase subunit M